MDIHVNHVPKLIKWKNKTTIIDFIARFYSPSVLLIALLTMFQYIDAKNIWILVPIAIKSALIQSYYVWIRWKKDFMYLAEVEYVIPKLTTACIIGTETIVQSFINLIMYWSFQADHIEIDRSLQPRLWVMAIFILLLVHILQWKMSARKMDALIRRTYEHVSPV